jgi:hypothetical protein
MAARQYLKDIDIPSPVLFCALQKPAAHADVNPFADVTW